MSLLASLCVHVCVCMFSGVHACTGGFECHFEDHHVLRAIENLFSLHYKYTEMKILNNLLNLNAFEIQLNF